MTSRPGRRRAILDAVKRDLGLIRQILLELESGLPDLTPANPRFADVAEDVIGYHVWLAVSAGLLEGVDITAISSPIRTALATGLTWAGHDFLDAARDESVWAKVTHVAMVQAGSVTFAVLKEMLVRATRAQLGLS
jgi:Hypothetical protein (DUF2513)